MKTIFKISSVIFLLAVTAVIFYLSFQVEDHNQTDIQMIEIEGNNYLPKEEYFKYARLIDKSYFKYLSMPVLKDRIKKHPYVKDAEVKYEGGGKVRIKITEKKFNAILLYNNFDYLLTHEFELLPVLPFTRLSEIPVIANASISGKLKLFSSQKNNSEIVTGFKIIDTINLLNPSLSGGVTEINFRNGGDITLSFSFFDFPVVIGRKNEVRKTFYFAKLWSSLEGKEELNSIQYIDLRFAGSIFIGFPEPETEEDTNS